jgi:hypothetical protein
VTEQTYCSSLQRIDLQRKLHPDAFPRNSSPSSHLERQEVKLELWDGVWSAKAALASPWSLISENSRDKVLQYPLPQAVLSWKRAIMHAIPAGSVVHPRRKETSWGFSLPVTHV